MAEPIYSPYKDFCEKYKDEHRKNTEDYFAELTEKSGINIEENRETVRQYNLYRENLAKLKTKLNWFRFLRVLMIITIVLIPLVIWKVTPKIRRLREEIEEADKKADELLLTASNQMLPLNSLFSDRDSLQLAEKTLPLLHFDDAFTEQKEEDMIENFDFLGCESNEESALDVLSGEYNENPFLFENKLIHKMGTETYHGYRTITWTETYRDANGKLQRRTRTETLHASVVKPKPFYSKQVVLNYGSQSGDKLLFSRDASHLNQKSERALEKHVKKGRKKIKKLTDNALKNNKDFVGMSNTDFEVLFDALDRTDEVQFRMLFSPLAQTNMTDLILSDGGYGDDFDFIKNKRMNKIISGHSLGRPIRLTKECYTSYSYDVAKESFIGKNTEYFKAVYFDFAPLWAIPSYQERPADSLKPIPEFAERYAIKECEALVNAADRSVFVHPDTKTEAILKPKYKNGNEAGAIVHAYSYDIEKRVDVVSVRGGDGHFHNVEVPWDEYIPLSNEKSFIIKSASDTKGAIVKRNGLGLFAEG